MRPARKSPEAYYRQVVRPIGLLCLVGGVAGLLSAFLVPMATSEFVFPWLPFRDDPGSNRMLGAVLAAGQLVIATGLLRRSLWGLHLLCAMITLLAPWTARFIAEAFGLPSAVWIAAGIALALGCCLVWLWLYWVSKPAFREVGSRT